MRISTGLSSRRKRKSSRVLDEAGCRHQCLRHITDAGLGVNEQQIISHEYTYSMRRGMPPSRKGMKALDQIKLMELSVDDMIAQQKTIQGAAMAAWGY